MSKLVWDKVGEKRYEAGVDRGVLYLPDGSGVPWNGLTTVEEDQSDVEVNSYYFDGVKYLDTRFPGDFSATIKAFTYPDEFEQFDGLGLIQNDMMLGNQPVYDRFGLCYRTLVGNDLDGNNHGYKIHVIYNLTAKPSNKTYNTLSDKLDPMDFQWEVSGVPEAIPGHRPTAHLILDTRKLNPYLVLDLEALLYGRDPEEIVIGDTDTTIVDGGDFVGYVDVEDFLDGGSVDTQDNELMDGGDPTTSTTGPVALINGGDLSTYVIEDVTDGGTPDTSDPGNVTIADLGTPTFFGDEIMDGGLPEFISTGVLDAGYYNAVEDTSGMDGGTPNTVSTNELDGGVIVLAGPEETADTIDGGDPESSGDGFLDGRTFFDTELVGGTEARLLPLSELVELVSSWTIIRITDNGDGTWTANVPDEFVTFSDSSTFEIRNANAVYLDEETYEFSTTHSF